MTKKTQELLDNPEAETTYAQANRTNIELDEAIKRGETSISEIQLRKPKAGELRGVALMDLAQMDVTALRKVLPRITAPSLTDQEIGNMTPADIMQCGVAVAGFLLTKRQKAQTDSPEA